VITTTKFVGDFGDQDDQRELTPDPDVGDLLNASFFLESGGSQVQLLATNEEMMVDVGGCEAVVESFLADASAPLPLLLDQDALGVEVQVSEETAKDGSEMVESLSAQEAVKLVAWRKAFYRIPHKHPLLIVQGQLKAGVTHMQATFMSSTLPCSEAFHASLTAYDRAVEVMKDTFFKLYILAAGDYAGCLSMTLPPLPPLPPYMFPTSTPPSLLPTSLPFLHAPSPPALRPHPPPSATAHTVKVITVHFHSVGCLQPPPSSE